MAAIPTSVDSLISAPYRRLPDGRGVTARTTPTRGHPAYHRAVNVGSWVVVVVVVGVALLCSASTAPEPPSSAPSHRTERLATVVSIDDSAHPRQRVAPPRSHRAEACIQLAHLGPLSTCSGIQPEGRRAVPRNLQPGEACIQPVYYRGGPLESCPWVPPDGRVAPVLPGW